MKAVCYGYDPKPTGRNYERTVLAEDVANLQVEKGEDVVRVIKTGPKIVATIKLGERDYVRLEP